MKPKEIALDAGLNQRASQCPAQANINGVAAGDQLETTVPPMPYGTKEIPKTRQIAHLLHREEARSHALKALRPQLGKCLYQAS